MYVYVPETVGDEEIIREKLPPNPPKETIVAAIRKTTDPAIAKRTIDAKIVQAATANRSKAEQMLTKLGIKFAPRSTAMGGLWSWLAGTGKLSDLSKYSPEQREKLMAFTKAANLDVIERTFTQSELDALLAKIRTGTSAPAGVGPLADPYSTAAQAYKASVLSALAPLGPTATTTGSKAAEAVSEGIVKNYQKGTSAPGRAFGWLGKLKWAVGLTALGVGGYFLWPKIKQHLGENSAIGRRLNAARTLLGGAS